MKAEGPWGGEGFTAELAHMCKVCLIKTGVPDEMFPHVGKTFESHPAHGAVIARQLEQTALPVFLKTDTVHKLFVAEVTRVVLLKLPVSLP